MTNLVLATFGTHMGRSQYRRFAPRALDLGVQRVLAPINVDDELKKCIYTARLAPKTIDLWVDSSAFELWGKGLEKSVQDYEREVLTLLPRVLPHFRKVFIISLDKIPGNKGEAVTRSQLEQATEVSLRNARYMLDRGIRVVPVHHQGEPQWVLDEYLGMTDYVGLSPANDQPHATRLAYVQSCWQPFKEKMLRTGVVQPAHSFGNTAPNILQNFPFYSADSQVWATTANFGEASSVDVTGVYRRDRYDPRIAKAGREAKVEMLLHNIKEWLEFEQNIKKLWAHRGIQWAEPNGVSF